LVFKDFQEGKPVEQIAQYYRLDLTTTWAQIVNNTNFGKINKDYSDGKPIGQIAQYHGLDLTTTWVIVFHESA